MCRALGPTEPPFYNHGCPGSIARQLCSYTARPVVHIRILCRVKIKLKGFKPRTIPGCWVQRCMKVRTSRERYGSNLHPFMTVCPRAASWFQRAPFVSIDNRTMRMVEQDARVLQLQSHKRATESLVQGGETQVDLKYCLASSSNPIM